MSERIRPAGQSGGLGSHRFRALGHRVRARRPVGAPALISSRNKLQARFLASIAAIGAMAAYGLINIWLGFNFVLLVVVAIAVVMACVALLDHLYQLAADKAASDHRCELIGTFAPGIASVLLLVEGVGLLALPLRHDMSMSFGWRNSTVPEALALSLCAVSAVWARRLRVLMYPRLKPGRKKRSARRAHTVAIVVVHGIGSHKPGSSVQALAGPMEQLLSQRCPGRVWVDRPPAGSGLPERVQFVYETQRRAVLRSVIVMEARWSDLQRRASGLRTIRWTLRSAPLLAVLALAPDNRDLRQPSLVRLSYRLALPLLILLSLLQPGLRFWSLALLIVLAASTAFQPLHLLGDVQLAATDEAQVAAITASINATIDEALRIAGRVIVVGHSQGGYLSHRALQDRPVRDAAFGCVELIGVGSGLKPISLLRRFSDTGSSVLAVLALAAVILVLAALAPLGLAFLLYLKPLLAGFLPQVVRSLVSVFYPSAVRPPHFDWRLMLPWVSDRQWARYLGWWQAGAFAAALALVVYVAARARRQISELQAADLARPAAARRWVEVTSYADSVGRLAYPRLVDSSSWEIPGSGNPLVDHVSYFRLSSVLPWILSCDVFAPALDSLTPALRSWTAYLHVRVWRSRALCAVLGLLLTAVYVFDRLYHGPDGTTALVERLRHPGLTIVAVVALVACAPALALIDRLRFANAMLNTPADSPPRLYQSAPAIRIASFVAWILLGEFAAASSRYLVRYKGIDSTEARLLSIAPAVVGTILFIIAAVVLVGYRLSLLGWTVGAGLAGYWTTYLPGTGPNLVVFMSLAIIAVAITSWIAARVFGHVAPSGPAWEYTAGPGPRAR